MHALGYSELNIEGIASIVNNAAIIYKNQSFFGDHLIVKLALEDPGYMSCNFKYLLLDKATAKEVARAQTGFVFLDYKSGELMEMPWQFRNSSAVACYNFINGFIDFSLLTWYPLKCYLINL